MPRSGLAAVASAGAIALVLVPVGIVLGRRHRVRAGLVVHPAGLGHGAGGRKGFKRLFDESENYHAEFAANAGIMRDYMGYAVTLGSVDKWTVGVPDRGAAAGRADVLAADGRRLPASVSSSATPPRSSSSGFSGGGSFGGGGSGGGGGGGGGGSW